MSEAPENVLAPLIPFHPFTEDGKKMILCIDLKKRQNIERRYVNVPVQDNPARQAIYDYLREVEEFQRENVEPIETPEMNASAQPAKKS